MVYIKKLVINGFKSFAKKTEILFGREVNVILGPNGSGKSNIADALCFVLGRLSIKSMRASKARNLLFMGSKYAKPVQEASVDLVFDNSDKTISIDKEEVHLTRIVRRNGMSVYKINGEVKTRAEVIELLAQAGIDPHGFNLILQGQIQSIVKMHSEERRKIIEEVAGISIYELQKAKSLHELEKTDEKLKEISSILRERTIFLRNLEKERSQALRFKELELNSRRCRASILQKKIDEKQKEIDSFVKSIEEKSLQKDKFREKADKLQKEITELGDEVQVINRSIQQATGIEQETLHNHIANLKAELEGLRVRKENYENRRGEIEKRIEENEKNIPETKKEIEKLREESPIVAKKAQELKKKKEELAILEEERGRLLATKTELNSLKEIIRDKERQLSYASVESESYLKQIESIGLKLQHKSEEECVKKVHSLRISASEKEKEMHVLRTEALEHEKIAAISQMEIARSEKIKQDVEKIDVCPLCQSKITEEHINHVRTDCDEKILSFNGKLSLSKTRIDQIKGSLEILAKTINELRSSISEGEQEISKQRSLKEKHEGLKRSVEREKNLRDELAKIEERRKNLENKITNYPSIQDRYDSKLIEIEEISSRSAENIDNALLYKERELEGVSNVIKRSTADLKEIIVNIKELIDKLSYKEGQLEENEERESELSAKFKKMFERRESLKKNIQEKSLELSELQNEARQVDEQINYLKIGKARADAERETKAMEMSDFSGIELIQGSISYLEERLAKTQEALTQIGSINMRALEIYDEIKKEYDAVQEKVNILDKEKQGILDIIAEIDRKKVKSFMKTFKAINEKFTINFSKLSTKGSVFLEIENEEDAFAGGVNIDVKLAKGKYFDVTSLSGGEQTLVALSLLFAIQEYKPYHFYIFDEIDAALDKRNSERLSALLNQYMKSGQYIVITHNEAIIMKSDVLYGVSMQEGVSKILSIKADGGKKEEPTKEENVQNENS